MECRQPGAIREEELLAYLAGESVRPGVAQHLANCEYCSAQLAAYRRIELTLTSTFFRWDCPSSQALGEYQLGMLTGEQVAAVRFHLNMCVHCTAEVKALGEFLANDPLLVEHAPEPRLAIQPQLASLNHRGSAQAAKQTLDAFREQARTAARRIVATLLPPQPRLALQREMVQAEALWPRRYTAEDFSISLHVERGTSRKDAVQLIGFITRQGTALETLQGTPVVLATQSGPVQTQPIDELGNFVFGSLSPETYTLELQFSEGVVVIEQLQVALQE